MAPSTSSVAAKKFTMELAKLKQLVDIDVPAMEMTLDAVGVPWKSDRLSVWDGGSE